MTVDSVVTTLINFYSDYNNLLDEEREILTKIDYARYSEIVKEKMSLVQEITRFEERRVHDYGEYSIDELIKKRSSKSLLKKKDILTGIVLEIQDKSEFNNILAKKIKNYSDKMLNTMVNSSKEEKITYGKDMKYENSYQRVNILDKKI